MHSICEIPTLLVEYQRMLGGSESILCGPGRSRWLSHDRGLKRVHWHKGGNKVALEPINRQNLLGTAELFGFDPTDELAVLRDLQNYQTIVVRGASENLRAGVIVPESPEILVEVVGCKFEPIANTCLHDGLLSMIVKDSTCVLCDLNDNASLYIDMNILRSIVPVEFASHIIALSPIQVGAELDVSLTMKTSASTRKRPVYRSITVGRIRIV